MLDPIRKSGNAMREPIVATSKKESWCASISALVFAMVSSSSRNISSKFTAPLLPPGVISRFPGI